MKYIKAYLSEIIKIFKPIGFGFLILSAIKLDGLALYLCWCGLLVAFAGPISIALQKEQK